MRNHPSSGQCVSPECSRCWLWQGLTPSETEARNVGAGWAAYAAAFQQLRRGRPLRFVPTLYLCSKPYLFNNPRFPAANSTVQVRHWWHPALVRNITTQLFAAGADSVNGKADAFLLAAAA